MPPWHKKKLTKTPVNFVTSNKFNEIQRHGLLWVASCNSNHMRAPDSDWTGHEGILLPLFTLTRKTMTSRIILHVATQSAVNKWQCSRPRDSDVPCTMTTVYVAITNTSPATLCDTTCLLAALHDQYRLPTACSNRINNSPVDQSNWQIMIRVMKQWQMKKKKAVAAHMITWPQILVFYKTKSITYTHKAATCPNPKPH